MDMTPQTWPEWYDGRHINEVLFCQQFLEKHPMKCVRGRLFTVDGLIEDEGDVYKRQVFAMGSLAKVMVSATIMLSPDTLHLDSMPFLTRSSWSKG